jgi:signal transduction histidine kinase
MDNKIINENLIIIEKELAFQNQEKERITQELLLAKIELKRVHEYHKEYIEGIELVIYMTSHQIRQPILNILGLSELVDLSTDTKIELKQTLDHIKTSAQSLDLLTKELNTYILELREKGKNRLL